MENSLGIPGDACSERDGEVSKSSMIYRRQDETDLQMYIGHSLLG